MVIKNSLQLQAYDTSKEQIPSNILTPGVLYSKTKTSKGLGISRTPIRGTLQCLFQDGYITIIPSRDFKICQLGKESMRESVQIRYTVEGSCVHLIASQSSRRHCQKLLKDIGYLPARQRKVLVFLASHSSFIEENYRFHLFLAHHADNDEFNHSLQCLVYMIHPITSSILSIEERVQAAFEEHQELYNCLKSGDGDRAYRTLIAHLPMPLNMDIL